MLLIVATRYDSVTTRMLAVAEQLLARARQIELEAFELFASEATGGNLRHQLERRGCRVCAFFGHGDDNGALLAQDTFPYWEDEATPNFSGGAIVAHACRAMRGLERQFIQLNTRLIVGYRVDLMLPPDGSDVFWETYSAICTRIPELLAQGVAWEQTKAEFHDLATAGFHRVNESGGSLVELLAIQQVRDELAVRCE